MNSPWAARLAAIGLSPGAAHSKRHLLDAVERALVSMVPAGRASREGAAYVPGRIEVLGKHTDYAGGRSLVCACERGFVVRWRHRDDGEVRLCEASGATLLRLDGHGEPRPPVPTARELRAAGCSRRRTHNSELLGILSTEVNPGPGPLPGWAAYASAVVNRLRRNFPGAALGLDVAFASDLPVAAGLSSSSALVIALALAAIDAAQLREHDAWRANIVGVEDLAGYLATIENGRSFGTLAGDAGVGTFGGSEDHVAILASAASVLGQWSYCPARLERPVRLPPGLTFAIGCSGVAAEKTAGAREAYNRTAQLASELLELWNATARRDDGSLAEALSAAPGARRQLQAIVAAVVEDAGHRRALAARLDQFAEESLEIVPAGAAALGRADLEAFGLYARRSQMAATRGLGNAVPETTALADLARASGAFAASPFGAGFGGSVWALVEPESARAFAARWRDEYARAFPARQADAAFFETGAGPAAAVL